MVSRFESSTGFYGDPHTRDDFDIGVRRSLDTGQPRLFGRCSILVGLALIVFGVSAQSFAPLLAEGSVVGPAPSPSAHAFPDTTSRYSGTLTPAHGSGPYGAWGNGPSGRTYDSRTGPLWDESPGVHERRSLVDPTLVGLCAAVFVGCLLPQVMQGSGYAQTPYLPSPPPPLLPPRPVLPSRPPTSGILPRWLSGLRRSSSVLPSEVEWENTYATLGTELPECVRVLSAFVEQQVIAPLCNELEQSNSEWTRALGTIGWRLTFDPVPVGAAPRLAMRELNVNHVSLPNELLSHPGAAEKWQRRQLLEDFLKIPSCKQAQRQYVLNRLQEWRHVGLAQGMRYIRQRDAAMPTDVHILENIVLKMLQQTTRLDFSSCFVSAAGNQGIAPVGLGRGTTPVAWLRQVSDAPPHYEVVAPPRVWKFRPSAQNLNILEAVAVLILELRKCPSSYQLIGQEIRGAIDRVTSGLFRKAYSF